MTIQLDRSEDLDARSAEGPSVPHALAALVVTGKVAVLVLVLRLLLDPAWANLEGKAPVARAIMYPLWMVAVPVIWVAARRAAAYPWGADLLVTLTCLTDLLGNRLDLYNSVDSFDDAVHFLNAALVSAAFLALTAKRSATLAEVLQAAVAFGLTASLGWELFEYGTFLTRSTEWASAYSDTVGDLSLGFLGSVFAGLLISAGQRLESRCGTHQAARPVSRSGTAQESATPATDLPATGRSALFRGPTGLPRWG